MAIPSLAVGSYNAAKNLLSPAGGGAQPGGFADLVNRSLGDFTEKAAATDRQVAQAVSGNSDLVSVVTAVSETENAVETLVAVRDKVIAAYDEIMRMSV